MSTYIEKLEDKKFALHENLTNPIVFTTVYTGYSVNLWAQVHGCPANAQIDRRDYILVYNTLLKQAGGGF